MSALPTLGRADAALTADATRVLYERYSNRIFAYCMSRLRTREEAEDAMQTTFLNAFRSLQSGVVPQFELAWLFRIAENVCRDGHKSASRRRHVETTKDLQEVQDTVSAPARNTDGLVGLADALADMPERQRRAILLREWQGLSYAEIADELGVSNAAVETLIFRARRSLARALQAPQMRRRASSFDVLSLLGLVKAAFKGGAAAKVAATGIALGGAALVVSVPLADRHRPTPDGRRPATAPLVSPVGSTPASRPASLGTKAGGASRPASDSSPAARTSRKAPKPTRPGAVPPSTGGSAANPAPPAEVPGGTVEVPTPAANPRPDAPVASPPPPTPPAGIPELPGVPDLPPVVPPVPLAPPALPPVPPVPPVPPLELPGLPPVPPLP